MEYRRKLLEILFQKDPLCFMVLIHFICYTVDYELDFLAGACALIGSDCRHGIVKTNRIIS